VTSVATLAERFREIVAGADENINLAEAALLIAADEYPQLDVSRYLAQLEDMATALKQRLPTDANVARSIVVLNRFLFEEQGFRGNAADFYDPRNSFLSDVLERKRGNPAALAVLYMEVGRRAGLPLDGIVFPGHFLVKCQMGEGVAILDPYAGGSSLDVGDLQQRVKLLRDGVEPPKAVVVGMLTSASKKEILVRMLRNLKEIYTRRKDWQKALHAIDRIVTVMPNVAEEYRDRGMMYLKLECARAALFDLQAYVKMIPEARDVDNVRARIVELQAKATRLN
jgi:regulator of sirC expression with transglutaminase-like and TPR domain